MDGVTILQTIETTARPDWAIGVGFICAMIGLLFAILAAVAFSSNNTRAGEICLTIALAALMLVIGIISLVPKVTTIKYRVLVDETVNMNEFFTKYELINKEGLIYLVKPID